MNVTLGRNDFITIIGSLMVASGAFMPMVNVAGLNEVSYADAADPEVYLLVLAAIAASVLIIIDKRKFSLFAALGAWLVMLWPIISNLGGGSDDDGGLLGKVTDAVADPLQKVAQELFTNVFDFEIGGFAFLIGMIAMLVGAIMNFMASRSA